MQNLLNVRILLNKRLFFVLLFLLIVLIGNFIAYKIVHIPAQLEITVIAAVFLFYPVLRFPKTGLYILFIVTPFIPFIRRLYYLQHNRPSVDALIIFSDLIIVFVITGLFFVFREKGLFDRGMKKTQLTVLIYFFYLLLRVFLMNILPVNEAILRFKLYGPAVLLFFAGGIYATDFKLLKKIWIITVVIGIASFIYALKQLIMGYSEPEQLWFSSISFTTLFIKGIARPFSFFQSPAAFADYMQLAIIGVMILSPWNKSVFVKCLLCFLFPFFFYGALVTSVRSNWIGIFISFFLLITIIKVKSKKRRLYSLFLLGLVFVVFNYLDAYVNEGLDFANLVSVLGNSLNFQYMDLLVTERIGAVVNPFSEYSMISRIALWKHLLVLTSDPLMALFGRVLGSLKSDSIYFTYLAEFGYPGMFFITAFQIFIVIKGFRLINRTSSNPVLFLAKGITIMNLVFLIVNSTGSHINSFPGDIYYWFWNGVLLKLEALERARTNYDEKNNDYSGFPA